MRFRTIAKDGDLLRAEGLFDRFALGDFFVIELVGQ